MNPYRIAICEDDAVVGEQLVRRCYEILVERQLSSDVQLFLSATELRVQLEKDLHAFDLFLLDIQMAEGESGLTLAQWIYDKGLRDQVVFITAFADYAVEGYQAHPLHYLLKPVTQEALEDVLYLALERHHPQKIVLRRGNKLISYPLEEIQCIESRDHGIIVHEAGSEQYFPMSLGEIEKLVPPDVFSHSHKSYLINLDWVVEITRREVILRDGEHYPVSRAFYRSFQTAFIRHFNHYQKNEESLT